MRFVVWDAETYYDPKIGYTLSKMTTEAYVRDPRFELHGAAIKWSASTAAQWYDDREVRYLLKEEDWSDVFLVSHHAQFDHLILSHHYDVHPKMSGCTMSMARLMACPRASTSDRNGGASTKHQCDPIIRARAMLCLIRADGRDDHGRTTSPTDVPRAVSRQTSASGPSNLTDRAR